MTYHQTTIEEMIEMLDRGQKIIMSSKKTARQFLINVGMIEGKKKKIRYPPKKKPQ